jgi:hypothetical protein
LIRAEASSTLRSNSVISILLFRINIHASFAPSKLHHYRGPSARGQSALCGRHSSISIQPNRFDLELADW